MPASWWARGVPSSSKYILVIKEGALPASQDWYLRLRNLLSARDRILVGDDAQRSAASDGSAIFGIAADAALFGGEAQGPFCNLTYEGLWASWLEKSQSQKSLNASSDLPFFPPRSRYTNAFGIAFDSFLKRLTRQPSKPAFASVPDRKKMAPITPVKGNKEAQKREPRSMEL